MKKNHILLIICMLLILPAYAQVKLVKETKITDEALHFWYPNNRKAYIYAATISPRGDCFTVANGYIFYGWYKGGMNQRNLMLSRKKIGGNQWKTIQFSDKNTLIVDPKNKQGPKTFGNTHQTITVAVSDNDGKVHILFDHHNSSLNYIVSKKDIAFAADNNFKLSNFEAKRNTLTDRQKLTITYPEINKNNKGELILNYRRGNSHGGNEFVHVYSDGKWSKAKNVVQGYQSPIPANKNNYAYGSPTYGNGRFYYSYSVRWNNNNAFNEGVYIAEAGNRLDGNWKAVGENKTYAPPIRNYAPFLIDDPATDKNIGSSGSPAFAVNDNGDMQVAYKGRGRDSKYFYTYTKKANETKFTKHNGVYIDADGYGDKFYAVSVSSRVTNGKAVGKITINSNLPGELKQKKELEISTNYNHGEFVKFIHEGHLYIISDIKANSDKHQTVCYEIKLDDTSTNEQQNNNQNTTTNTDNTTSITEGWYRIKNLETNRYLRSTGKENIIAASLRATGNTIIGTVRSAPLNDVDKVWKVSSVAAPSGTFRIELKDTKKYIYNETSNQNKDIQLSTKIGDRSKWILELVENTGKTLSTKTIDANLTNNGISIFPNPANQSFNINFNGVKNAQVSITNLLGKLVYSNKTSSNTIKVNVTNKFSKGIYLVRVIGDNQKIYNKKLVIK